MVCIKERANLMYIRPSQLTTQGDMMASCLAKLKHASNYGDTFVLSFRDPIARKHIKKYIEEWKFSRNKQGEIPLERVDYDFYCSVINMLAKHNAN